uniref:Uncharacterized protein n=1 Tax=Siphoviridae sp. ctHjK2 TaxID=2827831 RepID=A0A8S5SR78_9CAUD|nr:MAG TPA: hypothetical protein [Siphoviridae sp. ctHjK2]
MKEVIQSIIAVGGFGYLNYWIISRLKDFDFGNEKDKAYLVGLMTSTDYCFYIVVSHFITEEWLRVILTVLTAIIFSLCFPIIFNWLYKGINFIRKKDDSAELRPIKLKDEFFRDNKDYCFIFDFNNNLLSKGVKAFISGENEEFSLILYPFFESQDEFGITTEEELYHYLEVKKLEARIYLNFEKKLKIIYFSLEDE